MFIIWCNVSRVQCLLDFRWDNVLLKKNTPPLPLIQCRVSSGSFLTSSSTIQLSKLWGYEETFPNWGKLLILRKVFWDQKVCRVGWTVEGKHSTYWFILRLRPGRTYQSSPTLLSVLHNKLFAHFNFTKIKAKCKKPRGIYNFAL